MNYCLPSSQADDFLKRIKSGEIDPVKLADMTSMERRQYFSSFLGDLHAKNVNALFESKLLLKDQQAGMINWVKKVSGISPAVKKDLIAKVQGMQEVMNPSDPKSFLNDLVNRRLSLDVSLGEANKIADLAKNVDEKKMAMDKGGDRLEYGRALVEFKNYVNDLKTQSQSRTFKEVLTQPVETLSRSAGFFKALKSSLDNSALLRQGWKTLWTHPDVWRRNAVKSFSDIINTFGGKEVLNELYADIYSRPTYPLMQRAKLAIGNLEEAYPSRIQEKIPVVGKAFKASDVAYTSFLQKTRADVFDKYLDIAKRSGVDINNTEELQGIGKLVNSLTGRGDLGKLEPSAGVINNVFFSPRMLKANIDTLSVHALDQMTPFARKQAAINLLKVVSGTAAVLALAKAAGGPAIKIETDSRSSDFGQIRYKDTRFDVSGGLRSIVTLASRLATLSTKSASTGEVSPLNSGKFGAPTGADVVYNFFENKLSPAAALVKDLIKGEDFSGKKVTFLGEAANLAVPLPFNTYQEIKNNPNSANLLLAMIADALGVSVNTYSAKKKKIR